MISRTSCRRPRQRAALRRALAALLLTFSPALAVAQNARLDTGYTALATQLGVALPTGANVAVTQVEAPIITYTDDLNENDLNKVIQIFNWMPSTSDPGINDFSAVDFEFRSPTPSAITPPSPLVVTGTQSGVSAHAIAVGANFYGNMNSLSPGISNVDSYEANHWIGNGILKADQASVLPAITQNLSRVANHSYIGGISTQPGFNATEVQDVLQRVDFLVERDDLINVVGMNNGANGTTVAPNGNLIGSNTTTLLSFAANTISVGTSALAHVNGTRVDFGEDPVYGSNGLDANFPGQYIPGPNYREHPRPDLVAPAGATSYATPLVSSAAVLLIQASKDNPSWSTTSYSSPRIPSQTIRAADTSEVIRAALMAGADRTFFNSDGVKALDYRTAAVNQSPNGLDRRYGAGQLNVRNAYDVLAGTQHAVVDQMPVIPADPIVGIANVPVTGFDYDQSFGGDNGSNSISRYNFTGSWTGQNFSTSLVWNVGIDTDNDNFYIPSAALYNLNLRLLDVTGPGPEVEIAVSWSDYENTENIFATLEAGRNYQLEVTSPNAGTFEWDYGIAWNGTSNQVWLGVGNNAWDNNTTANWQRGTNTATKFLNNDQVVFTDLADNKNVNIAAPVSPDFVTVNSTSDYTFSGSAITGPGGLFKQGTGTLILNNANTFSGSTAVSGGSLKLSNSLALQNSTVTTGGTGIIFDSSVVTHAFTFGGLAGSTNLVLADNAGSPNAVALTVGSNNSSNTYSGNLSGDGSFTKIGTGSQTLSGTNSYTGGTYISAGRLVVNGSATGPVEVQLAGTLGGNGTIIGNVSGAGTVAPGNSIGTLHIAGAYNITGTNDFEISKVGSTLTGDLVDQITDLTYDGILKVTRITGSDASTTYIPGNSWNLFNFSGTPMGQFDNFTDFGMLGGGGNLPALNDNYAWNFDYSSGVLSVVPEPGTWVAMLGMGIVALQLGRKKRKATASRA